MLRLSATVTMPVPPVGDGYVTLTVTETETGFVTLTVTEIPAF